MKPESLTIKIIGGFILFFSLGMVFFSEPTHDYVPYLKQWKAVLSTDNPWIDKSNAYGPLHSALAVFYNVHPNFPKFLFVLFWIFTSWGITNLAQKNKSIPIHLNYLLKIILWFNPLIWVFVVRFGTNDILMAALVTYSIFLYKKEKEIPSGIFMALAVAVKFIPLVMVPFLILNKRRIKWKFGVSLISSLLLIFGISYLIWGNGIFHPFIMGAERPSKILSVFRFLRGEFSPLGLIWEDANLDGLSVYLTLICLVLFFILYVKNNLDWFLSSIIGIGVLLTLYKVGHHQFYITPIFLILLWISLYYKNITLSKIELAPIYLFIAWISLVSLLYVLTQGYRDTGWREILGLPTFAISLWMLYTLYKFSKLEWKEPPEHLISRDPAGTA